MRVEELLAKKTRASAPLLGAAAIFYALALATATSPALARPFYAQQTGLPCGQCHVNPEGGGPRNAFGLAFAANGHRLPGEVEQADRSGGDESTLERHCPGRMGHGMMGHGMMGHGMMRHGMMGHGMMGHGMMGHGMMGHGMMGHGMMDEGMMDDGMMEANDR